MKEFLGENYGKDIMKEKFTTRSTSFMVLYPLALIILCALPDGWRHCSFLCPKFAGGLNYTPVGKRYERFESACTCLPRCLLYPSHVE